MEMLTLMSNIDLELEDSDERWEEGYRIRQYREALALPSLSSQGSWIAKISHFAGFAELMVYCCAMRDLCAFCCQMRRRLGEVGGRVLIKEWRVGWDDCAEGEMGGW